MAGLMFVVMVCHAFCVQRRVLIFAIRRQPTSPAFNSSISHGRRKTPGSRHKVVPVFPPQANSLPLRSVPESACTAGPPAVRVEHESNTSAYEVIGGISFEEARVPNRSSTSGTPVRSWRCEHGR